MNASSGYSRGDGSSATAEEQREGPVARRIEKLTAQVPSDVYLWAAGAAMAASLSVQIVGLIRGQRREMAGRLFGRTPKMSSSMAGFIGQWVPSILLLGVYNKIVKVAGSDRANKTLGRSS